MKKILFGALSLAFLVGCSDNFNKDSVVKGLQKNNVAIVKTESVEIDTTVQHLAKEHISSKLADGIDLQSIICDEKSKCDSIFELQSTFGMLHYLKQSTTGKVIFFVSNYKEKPSAELVLKMNKTLEEL